ncbi:LysR family transcriptional regulator [Dactylosporangium cerinum]|uniref:LysR family transcriptional regulator n=1 Tax=Dactylosporangium cerinum TaxID=1434730 RepID=A0ABV9VT12_9ACTN
MWETIELRELRAFLVLAEELHFGRTAQRLGLTQSRVSQTIRALERKLGTQLAHRTSRRVALTGAGERFRAEAGERVAALEAVLRATSDRGRRAAGTVRLGVVTAAVVDARLRSGIDRYTAAAPGNAVEVVGLPFQDRFGPLRRGEAELMVTGSPLCQPDLVTGPVLARLPRMLAVGRGHPLAAFGDVSVEDLADHPIADLDIELPDELRAALTPRRTPGGRPIPRVGARVREVSELLLVIAGNRVVQPVTGAFAGTYGHPDVVYRPIRDLPKDRFVLAWRRRNRHAGLREFLRTLTTGGTACSST